MFWYFQACILQLVFLIHFEYCSYFICFFSCKQNIHERTCDRCAPGYYAFPYCESCDCDIRGTTSEICDKTSAECFCKKYVTGHSCHICREGTFNLQENNDEGCTECFCFGKTTRCTSSNYFISTISLMKNWSLVALDDTENFVPLNATIEEYDQEINIDFVENDFNSNFIVYFSAPSKFLGKLLTSYGGFLRYKIHYTIGESGTVFIHVYVYK